MERVRFQAGVAERPRMGGEWRIGWRVRWMVGRIAHPTVFDQHADGSARPGGVGSEAPASCWKHASGMTGDGTGPARSCDRANAPMLPYG